MKRAFLSTLHFLWRRWYLVLAIVLLEIAFLFFFGRAYAVQFQALSVQLESVNALLQSSVSQFVESNDAAAIAAVEAQMQQQFEVISAGIIKILLYLLGYWLVFQGLIWYLAHRIVGNKNFFDFAWRFLTVTVVWFAIAIGAIGGMVRLSASQYLTAVPLIGSSGMNVLTLIVAVLLFYALLAAYCVLETGFWKTWYQAAIKRITTTGLAYVLGIISIYLLGKLFVWLFFQHRLLSFAFALVIIIPFVAALRVFFIEVIKEKN